MLENFPNITSVNFSGCDGYTKDWRGNRDEKVSEGIYGMLFCEFSFPRLRPSPHLMECSFLRVAGSINRTTFDVLCGVETLNLKGTHCEFAAWVIGKYKKSGNHLVEIKDVPRDIQGSIEVLEFVAAHLNVLDLHDCSRIEGKQTSNEISWDLLCAPVRNS